MELKALLAASQDEMIGKLQKAVSFRSVREEDNSGYPYGQGVQDCLMYMLELGRELGFRTVNMDNQVGWCEYGEGEEMVAVLGHLDVVPAGEGWTVAPYGGEIIDGRLGMRISHGCVRLRFEDSRWLYESIPIGTTVFIR